MIRIPTLKNVLRIEAVLRGAKEPLNKEQIKKRLPVKTQHSTLNITLDYLKASKKITQTSKGISWTLDEGSQERKIVKELEKTAGIQNE